MGLHLYFFPGLPVFRWGCIGPPSAHPRLPFPELLGFIGQWKNPDSLMLKALATLFLPRYCLSIYWASLGDAGESELALPLVGGS